MNQLQAVVILIGIAAITAVLVMYFVTNPMTLNINSLPILSDLGIGKPSKPQIGIFNQDIVSQFDILYDKYPKITQQDVNNVQTTVTALCVSYINNMPDKTEGARDTIFGQAMTASMCGGVTTGLIENYLDQLDVRYYSEGAGQPPTVFNS